MAIPKKGGVEDLKDFCPISLVGGLYKLLAKVLAYRFIRTLLCIDNFVPFFFDIGAFLDSDLFSIEDSRLLFIQSNCHM